MEMSESQGTYNPYCVFPLNLDVPVPASCGEFPNVECLYTKNFLDRLVSLISGLSLRFLAMSLQPDFVQQNLLKLCFNQEFTEVPAESGQLPYWHVNIPVEQREEECPEFLREISDRNKEILTVPADSFQYLTWADVKSMIGLVGMPMSG